jgi:hypothetical protein
MKNILKRLGHMPLWVKIFTSFMIIVLLVVSPIRL